MKLKTSQMENKKLSSLLTIGGDGNRKAIDRAD